MFDRSDALWREEPTREPAQKPARDDRPTDDLARQVEQRPGAPGQHPRDGDPERADAHPDDPARAHLAAERRARTDAARARLDAATNKPRRRASATARAASNGRAPQEEGDTINHHPLGPDGQAAFQRAIDRARRAPQARPTRPEEYREAPPPRQGTPPDGRGEAVAATADRRQDRQATEDGRAWTEDRAWTGQDRAGIQRFKPTDTKAKDTRTNEQIEVDAYGKAEASREYYRSDEYHAKQRAEFLERRAARQNRAEAQPRTGHRREYTAREAQPRERRSRADRDRNAIADVGMYRAVSYKDISEQHYDGHPYATRRAVSRMVRDGFIEEHEATGPEGNSFKVLTATEKGRAEAHRAALEAGHQPEQRTWTGLVKPAELSHDTAVYRAALDERVRIEAEGGRVVRVRLDAELKSIVAKATEKARAERGDRAADEAKAAAAQELGLPMKDGHVMYPDAQLEIEDADGVSGRVNVEIASDHYHAAAIVAKAGAGFAMHGSSRSAGQKIGRALGNAAARETDSGPGGGSGPGRDGSVEL